MSTNGTSRSRKRRSRPLRPGGRSGHDSSEFFDHLKEHPLAALLACAGFPALAFLIGYGMVTLRVGNGRIHSSLVSLTLVLGDVCGAAAGRSPARLPIRILGVLAAVAEFFYAFIFLFSATIGFR